MDPTWTQHGPNMDPTWTQHGPTRISEVHTSRTHLARPHLPELVFWPNFLLLLFLVVACCCLLVLVGACWCLLVLVGACWCLLVPVGACWCLLVDTAGNVTNKGRQKSQVRGEVLTPRQTDQPDLAWAHQTLECSPLTRQVNERPPVRRRWRSSLSSAVAKPRTC